MSETPNPHDIDQTQLGWAEGTRVLDESGDPLVVYHGTCADFEEFSKQRRGEPGFHFGTIEQARMRCGKKGVLKPALLRIYKPKRLKDRGQWNRGQIDRAAAEGCDGIVYLNRFEGIDKGELFSALEKYPGDKLDHLSDAEFRKVFPSARDSYIVFDPKQILLLPDAPAARPVSLSLPVSPTVASAEGIIVRTH